MHIDRFRIEFSIQEHMNRGEPGGNFAVSRGFPLKRPPNNRPVGRIQKSSKSPLQFFMGFLLGPRTWKNSIGKVLKKWLKVLPEIDLQVLPVTSFSDFFRSESAHSTQNFLLFLLHTKNRGVRILPEFSFLISSNLKVSNWPYFVPERSGNDIYLVGGMNDKVVSRDYHL